MKVNAKQQEEKQVIKEAKGLQKKHDLQRKLDRELKSCLRCKYFYGNNSQCIKYKCFNEKKRKPEEKPIQKSICDDCNYRQGREVCFPCYKKILGEIKEDAL